MSTYRKPYQHAAHYQQPQLLTLINGIVVVNMCLHLLMFLSPSSILEILTVCVKGLYSLVAQSLHKRGRVCCDPYTQPVLLLVYGY